MAYTEDERKAAEKIGVPPYIHPITGEVFYGGEQIELEPEDDAIIYQVWDEIRREDEAAARFIADI